MPKLLAVEKKYFFLLRCNKEATVPVKMKVGVFSTSHFHFNTQNWETKARIALLIVEK